MCGVSACENRQSRVSHGEGVRVASLSLCLTAAAHASSNVHTHTYRNIWTTTANQRGGVRPSLSLIGLDHDMSLTCLVLNSRETF